MTAAARAAAEPATAGINHRRGSMLLPVRVSQRFASLAEELGTKSSNCAAGRLRYELRPTSVSMLCMHPLRWLGRVNAGGANGLLHCTRKDRRDLASDRKLARQSAEVQRSGNSR